MFMEPSKKSWQILNNSNTIYILRAMTWRTSELNTMESVKYLRAISCSQNRCPTSRKKLKFFPWKNIHWEKLLLLTTTSVLFSTIDNSMSQRPKHLFLNNFQLVFVVRWLILMKRLSVVLIKTVDKICFIIWLVWMRIAFARSVAQVCNLNNLSIQPIREREISINQNWPNKPLLALKMMTTMIYRLSKNSKSIYNRIKWSNYMKRSERENSLKQFPSSILLRINQLN